jgi:hypothetical protein
MLYEYSGVVFLFSGLVGRANRASMGQFGDTLSTPSLFYWWVVLLPIPQ